ncbi:MAG: hypothetical protein R3B57_00385 [Phycisphaerales bacterium]
MTPAKWCYIVIASIGVLVVAKVYNASRQPTWKRETPLIDPLRVVSVSDGVLQLEDGRKLRPAGIEPAEAVTQEEFDRFLKIATAQGVVVDRVVSDDRALLTVEPRFWNWCGTSQRDLHWAGSYIRAPLSELAILCAYAIPDLELAGLTGRDVWRLQGCFDLCYTDEPDSLRDDLNAIEYGGQGTAYIRDIDMFIEVVTDASPP